MAEAPRNEHASPQQLLNSIIDSAFFGIMAFKSIRDINNEIIDFEWIFANKIAAQIVEFEIQELIGARLLKLLPGNVETGLFQKYKDVVETGNHVSIEQHYTADEMDIWFQITASKLDDGFTVTFQDISDLKSAQAEQETKGKKYQKLFDESIDPIYLLDEEFRFLNVNSSFLSLFGFIQNDVIKSPIRMLFLEESDYTPFEITLRANKKIDELEVNLITHDNLKRICLINCVSVYDEEKQQKNYLGVIRDMTKRKRAEKDIIIAEKLSMTGKIARTIAHEVRNPLTNLSLSLDQLKDEIPEQNEDAAMYIGIIERNVSRIDKLITDLLNSSKPKELNLVNQSIRHLVQETLLLVKDRLHLRDMQLHEEFSDTDFYLPLDSDQFKIAILNLLINAIEAMEPNEGVLKISLIKTDENIELAISDNGKGISSEEQTHLFEPFFTGKSKGTGLGLITVQNIVRSHNGKIEVESTLGEGTTFTIRFPLNNVE